MPCFFRLYSLYHYRLWVFFLRRRDRPQCNRTHTHTFHLSLFHIYIYITCTDDDDDDNNAYCRRYKKRSVCALRMHTFHSVWSAFVPAACVVYKFAANRTENSFQWYGPHVHVTWLWSSIGWVSIAMDENIRSMWFVAGHGSDTMRTPHTHTHAIVRIGNFPLVSDPFNKFHICKHTFYISLCKQFSVCQGTVMQFNGTMVALPRLPQFNGTYCDRKDTSIFFFVSVSKCNDIVCAQTILSTTEWNDFTIELWMTSHLFNKCWLLTLQRSNWSCQYQMRIEKRQRSARN